MRYLAEVISVTRVPSVCARLGVHRSGPRWRAVSWNFRFVPSTFVLTSEEYVTRPEVGYTQNRPQLELAGDVNSRRNLAEHSLLGTLSRTTSDRGYGEEHVLILACIPTIYLVYVFDGWFPSDGFTASKHEPCILCGAGSLRSASLNGQSARIDVHSKSSESSSTK